MDAYTPTQKDKFTFGLWTTGNAGRDPFGEPVRDRISPIKSVENLAKLGAWGVNLHDNDLVPINATPAERDQIIKDFKKALTDNGMRVVMGTTNLFGDPSFKDGAFTSNNPTVRAWALKKVMDSMDMCVDLGAEIYVFWGGREGSECDAAKDAVDVNKRFRECLNFLCGYSKDQGYNLKFALEAKPNEPRGDIYLPTTGAMLAMISTLDDPSMVGVNPEVAHENMAGLNFYHAVAQAVDAGKLFHIDLNAQKFGRYDQDLRFGSEDVKGAFYLVKLLEDSGYAGPRHFDAHAYRTEDEAGVWDFAAGCMRTYLILKDKVKRFNEDKEIQAIIAAANPKNPEMTNLMGKFSKANADTIKATDFDRVALGKIGLQYEKLDQLTLEIIMGVR